MYKLLLLIATFLAVSSTGSTEYRSCQMALISPLDPCQRACELEKLGVINIGKFNLNRLSEVLEEANASSASTRRRKNLLRIAFKICQKASGLADLDDCTFASVMYQQDTDDDIISKKSLQAVKQTINFLKEHAREEGLFRRAGRRDLRRRILNSLKRGEKPQLGNNNAALECAAALQLFLSRLKKPVMPQHVQELLLADNPGVTAHVIARDALGLIRQDVGGRHGELLAGLLDLLRHLTLSGPPSERSELRGSPLPIALLPVFFTLTPADLVKWKQVAARFSELITEAPEQLQLNENQSYGLDSRGNRGESTANEAADEQAESTRLHDISLFYPTFRLSNEQNASQVGEIARILATPLHRPPASRLHPAISNSNRWHQY